MYVIVNVILFQINVPKDKRFSLQATLKATVLIVNLHKCDL